MLSLVPAVLGIPGGIELLVIFFILFLLFGVPVALALLLGYRYVKSQTADERVAALEHEIEELRNELDAIDGPAATTNNGDSTASTSTGDSSTTITDDAVEETDE